MSIWWKTFEKLFLTMCPASPLTSRGAKDSRGDTKRSDCLLYRWANWSSERLHSRSISTTSKRQWQPQPCCFLSHAPPAIRASSLSLTQPLPPWCNDLADWQEGKSNRRAVLCSYSSSFSQGLVIVDQTEFCFTKSHLTWSRCQQDSWV